MQHITVQQVTSAAPAVQGAQAIHELLRQAPAPAQGLLRALVTAQARHALFLPDQHLLVAVSGGADSVCLLHALHQLAPHWRFALHVAHVDHALRPASAQDAAFVATMAAALEVPFHSTRLAPGIIEDDPGGVEEAARSARYAFLRQIATRLHEETGAPVAVATAHHQDDQAETLLLHLVQGSGLAGLAAMAWSSHIPDAQQPPVRLVRPLLGISRADIYLYLRSYGLQWCEDSSNRDPAHLRNRLRHEVLPLLAAINPNIHATLARTADLLAAEAEHAAQRDQAALIAVTITFTPSTRLVLDLFQLAQYDLATQRGVLRQALLTLDIDLRTVGMEKIEHLLDRMRATGSSGPHPLVAGWAWTRIRRSDQNPPVLHLALHRNGALPVVVEHPHLGAPLTTPLLIPREGSLLQNGWHLQSSLLPAHELPADWRSRSHPWRFFGDDEQCGDLYLTTFQPAMSPAMSIAPLGMGGHRRTLGDIFTDHKIPPFLRPGWPVVVKEDGTEDGTVVWLCGLVVSEAVRIQSSTCLVRQLLWQPETRDAL